MSGKAGTKPPSARTKSASGFPYPTICYGTGLERALPEDWSSDMGGSFACQYSASFGRVSVKKETRVANEPYFCCVRLIGSATLRVSLVDSITSINQLTSDVQKAMRPWDKTTGEPTWGGMVGNLSIPKIVNGLRSSQPTKESETDANWLALALQLMTPGGQWHAPFALAVAPSSTADLSRIGQGNSLTLRVHLYATRLLFYLIADQALADFVGLVQPYGDVRPTFSLKTKSHPQVFSVPESSASPFSTPGIMQRCANTGYESAIQPDGIALEMKSYQLQTLQWMLDQEALELGLNGVFWQKRAWDRGVEASAVQTDEVESERDEKEEEKEGEEDDDDDDLVPLSWRKRRVNSSSAATKSSAKRVKRNDETSVASQQGERFYYFSQILGELRLQEPPLVRGGLLCEEMGMGKTLEVVALILASRHDRRHTSKLARIPKVQPRRSDVMETGATLVVVPDPLVDQWVKEISKSLKFSHQLRVCTYLAHSVETIHEICLLHDVVITTFSKVQKDGSLQTVMWKRVVIDEMQEIRSSTTQVAKMCENLSAHNRWMVSGTPLFTGVKDLNGLLNFLSVWPFSLHDSIDGFWNQRIDKPMNKSNDDEGEGYEAETALELLHVLLDNVMMRHVKKQKFVTPPYGSILVLPASEQQLVGLNFDTIEEESSYRHLELLSVKALLKHPEVLGDLQQQQQQKLAVSGFEILRQICVSSNLVAGGCGVKGYDGMTKLASMCTDLLSSSTNTTDLFRAPTVGGRTLGQKNNDPKKFMEDVTTVRADQARDYFLSIRAQQVHADSVGSESHLQNTRDRLENSRNTVDKLRANIFFMKAHAGEDGLPRRRWKWAIRAITSGAYFTLNWCLRKRDKESFLASPLLARRGLQLYKLLKKYAVATVKVDQARKQMSHASPETLFEMIGVSEYKVSTKLEHLFTGGVTREKVVLMFSPLAVQRALKRLDDKFESHHHATQNEGLKTSFQGTWVSSVNPLTSVATSASSGRPFPSRPLFSSSSKAIDNGENDDDEEDEPMYDFYQHHDFWRSHVLDAALLKSSFRLKQQESLCFSEYKHLCPSMGLDVFSTNSQWMVAAALWNESNHHQCQGLWYWDNLQGDRLRAWFPLQGIPERLDSDGKDGEKLLLRGTFLDGTTRVLRSEEFRIVENFFASENEAYSAFSDKKDLLKAHLEKAFLTAMESSASNDVQDWMRERVGKIIESKFGAAIIQNDDFFRTPQEQQATSKTHGNRLHVRRRKFQQVFSETRLEMIYSEIGKKSQELSAHVDKSEKDFLAVLKAIILQPLGVSDEELAFTHNFHAIWKNANNEDALDKREGFSIGLGLKGQTHHRSVFMSKFDRNAFLVNWCQDPSIFNEPCTIRFPLNSAVVDSEGNKYDELRGCEIEGFVGEPEHAPSATAFRSCPEANTLISVKCGNGIRFKVPHAAIRLSRATSESTTTTTHSAEKFIFKTSKICRLKTPLTSNTWSEACCAHKRKMNEVVQDAFKAYRDLPEIEQYVSKLETALQTQRTKLLGHQGFQALEALANMYDFEKDIKELPCAICVDDVKQPVVTKCLHLYCFDCLLCCHAAFLQANPGREHAFRCPLCRQLISPEDVIKLLPPSNGSSSTTSSNSSTASISDSDENDSVDAATDDDPRWTPAVNEAKVKANFSSLPSGMVVWDSTTNVEGLVNSRKTIHNLAAIPRTIRTYLRFCAGVDALNADPKTSVSKYSTKLSRVLLDVQNTEGKIVIFSQFANGVAHLASALHEREIPSVRIAKGVPQAEIVSAVKSFNENPAVKVMCLHAVSAKRRR